MLQKKKQIIVNESFIRIKKKVKIYKRNKMDIF